MLGRRVMIVALGAILFALSMVMGTGALAGEKSGGLTPEQREQFVEGAGEVAGLSEREISEALKDPEAVDGIPVRVEVTRDRPEAPVRSGDRVASGCSSMGSSVNYVNARGERLFTFSARKEWCFNGYSAVTFAPGVQIDHRITEKGRDAGWEYRGTAERTNKFVEFRGFPRGSHVSKVVAVFKSCKPGRGCMTGYPQYRGVGNYDGTGFQSTKRLSDPPN